VANSRLKTIALSVALVASAGLMTQASVAQNQSGGFAQYLDQVAQRARSEGVSAATINRVLPSLTYNDTVVRLDRAQPETVPGKAIPDFAPYKRKHVDAARINAGRTKYRDLRPLLPFTGMKPIMAG
jgi:membrane-bound lytic murein transglycosylase B